MAYIKFLDSDLLIPCNVTPHDKNIVSLSFDNSVIVDTSGFKLYLDKNGEYEIGDYSTYTTIYRNDETTAEFNGYQLSNNKKVYETPKELVDLIDTEELEKQNKISNVNTQIQDLKQQLAGEDYKIIKAYEYSVVGKIAEYDINELHAKRELIRNQINELERELLKIGGISDGEGYFTN